jgi:uncharacterized protein YndB with AHSA1/START domain
VSRGSGLTRHAPTVLLGTVTGVLVSFSLRRHIAAAPSSVWESLVDWSGHADWMPRTTVEVSDAARCAPAAEPDVESFTMFARVGPFVVEDRLAVRIKTFDGARGTCQLDRLGPTVHGSVRFVVEPLHGGTVIEWRESVEVALPGWLNWSAPVARRAATRVARRRLQRGLRRLTAKHTA